MSDIPAILNLRRRIFSADDPSAHDDLLDELVNKVVANRQEASPSAPMLDVGSLPQNTFGDFPKLRISAKIRSSHIPTAIAHLLLESETPLVTVNLSQNEDRELTFRVSASVEGYSSTAVKTVVVKRAAGPVDISLLPTFFPLGIHEIKEITAATVHVAVQKLTGELLSESTGRIWLLPPQSMILESRDPATGKRTDFKRYLAAYVTPNDPDVLAFLPKAAALHPNGQLAGDNNISEANIRLQVTAVYQALKAAGFRYINSLSAFFPEEGLSGQRVRLPGEALKVTAGNCIDGVLVFASLLEAISLHPALVFLDGHAIVAWETERDSDKWEYIETTMLGSAEFEVANTAGNKVARKFEQANLLARFPLREARKIGLFPLA